MRQIVEKALEYGVSTFHLFIDFKAAYENTNREKRLEARDEFNITQKLIGLT
jgi:sorting nexin-29